MGLALTVVFPLAPVLLHHVVLGHGGGRMGLAGAAAGEGGNERRDAERTLRPRSLNLTQSLEIRANIHVAAQGIPFSGPLRFA
jgi:hypothetical protein